MKANQLFLLVIFLILQFFFNESAVRQSRRRHSNFANHHHQSPLDAENENGHHEFTAGSFGKLGPEVLIPDQVALDKLPECQHECNTAFGNAMKVALQAGNHHERFLGVCRHYNESIICHDKLIACPGRESFDILTSGLYYMCIDQRRGLKDFLSNIFDFSAFDKIIDCLDTKSNEVQHECENQCKGQNRFSEWTAKSGLFNVLSRSENVLRDFDPEKLRTMFHDMCDLTKCYLTCIRTTYNTKCGDNAGTLLSEAIVRPLAETQADPFMKSMSVFMYPFVPQQCSFFVKEEELVAHRIDPKVDDQLRRRAEEEDKAAMQNSMNATGSSNLTSSNQAQNKNTNNNSRTATARDMGNFDPIDIGEKWGFDIGVGAHNDY